MAKRKNLAVLDAPKSPAKRRNSMKHVLTPSKLLNHSGKKHHRGKRHRSK